MKSQMLSFVIQNAIDREVDAYELYMGLAEKMQAAEQKITLTNLANEELKHKEVLENLDISQVPEDTEVSFETELPVFEAKLILEQTATINEIIEFAIQKEQESYLHYLDISNSLPSGKLKDLFQFLAEQEKGHMARLKKIQEDIKK